MTANADIVAMVLAAGEGTRLRPLTHHCPKPLLPFCGVPVLQRILDNLRALQLAAIGVNTHHLAGTMTQWLHAHAPDVLIHHEAALLGSGGGVRAMSALLPAAEHFLYHNGDVFTDASIQRLIDHHRATDADVTMLLTAGDAADGNVGFETATGRIVALPTHEGIQSVASKEPRRTSFAGVMLFRRSLPDRLPIDHPAPCIIRDGIAPLMREGGRIQGVFHEGLFSDLGTPERWIAGLRSVQAPPFSDESLPGIPEAITLTDGRDCVRFVP